MPRAYTVATAAVALGVPTKWIDNALSHHKVAGITQQRQGIPRRLTIARDLVVGAGSLQTSNAIIIKIDLQSLKDRLLSRLEHAVEVAPLPRRGRPPKNTTGRLE